MTVVLACLLMGGCTVLYQQDANWSEAQCIRIVEPLARNEILRALQYEHCMDMMGYPITNKVYFR